MPPSPASSSHLLTASTSPDAPLRSTPNDPDQVYRIKRLWSAVIRQTLKDAGGPKTYLKSDGHGVPKRRVDNPHRPDARRAIFDGRLDGACHVLGFPPSALREYAEKRGWRPEDERRETVDETTDGSTNGRPEGRQ